ncbi:hypothetical protein EMCRGX_G029783 [Ephydatia muelleri]
MYDISHDARGKENLISLPKRDEAAQQNEAPVAGSVEGQSVPACKNRDTSGKSGLVKTVQPYWRQQPWKEWMDAILAMEFDKVPFILFSTAGFNLRNGTEAMICYRKRWI